MIELIITQKGIRMKIKYAIILSLLIIPIYLFSFPNLKQKIINHYTRKISKYRDQDNFEKALSINNKLILISPDNTDLYYWRALTYQDLENYDLAAKDFTRTIELNETAGLYTHREEGILYRNRGECWLELEKYDLAMNDAEISLERNPYYYSNYNLQRRVFWSMEEYDKAIEVSKIICHKFPNNLGGFYYRARSYHDLEQYDLAIKDYNYIINQNQDNNWKLWSYYAKAVSNYELGRYDEALGNFLIIDEKYQETTWHYGSLALLYYKMGDLEKANNCISQIYDDEPEYRDDIDSVEGFLDGTEESKTIFRELKEIFELNEK